MKMPSTEGIFLCFMQFGYKYEKALNPHNAIAGINTDYLPGDVL